MSSLLDDLADEIEPAPDGIGNGRHKAFRFTSIDVGTSGVRAALFDERGEEVPGAWVRHRRKAETLSDLASLMPTTSLMK